jgi:hypothetical protein
MFEDQVTKIFPTPPHIPANSRRAASPQKDVTTHDDREYSVKAAGVGDIGAFGARRSFMHATLSLHALSLPLLPLRLFHSAALVHCYRTTRLSSPLSCTTPRSR